MLPNLLVKVEIFAYGPEHGDGEGETLRTEFNIGRLDVPLSGLVSDLCHEYVRDLGRPDLPWVCDWRVVDYGMG
jgi:hypothetical protein